MKMGPRNCDLICDVVLMFDVERGLAVIPKALLREELLVLEQNLCFCMETVLFWPLLGGFHDQQSMTILFTERHLTVKKSLCGKNKKPLHDEQYVTVKKFASLCSRCEETFSLVLYRLALFHHQIASCFCFFFSHSFEAEMIFLFLVRSRRRDATKGERS